MKKLFFILIITFLPTIISAGVWYEPLTGNLMLAPKAEDIEYGSTTVKAGLDAATAAAAYPSAGIPVSTGSAWGTSLSSTAPNFTTSITSPIHYHGVAGSTVGQAVFYNATSGSITIQPTTGALGTITLTLPAVSGTILQSGTAVTVDQGGLGITSGTSGGIPYFKSTSAIASSAALTAKYLVLGGGVGASPKVAAGLTTDGTSVLNLGVAGTAVGGIAFRNATSGSITIQPTTDALGTVTLTLPAVSGTILQSGTAVTVDQGGLGITSGTSGGIPYFSSTSAIASSAALTANALVLGGGAGAAPKVVTAITTDGTAEIDLGTASTTTGTLGLYNSGSAYKTSLVAGAAAAAATITLPAATGTLATLAGTETFTNKTIGTGTVIPVTIGIACSDESTALTTGTAKATFRVPHAMTLTAVRASVGTAPVGSTIIVDINEGGTTIMSTTKLSIDASEKTSTTAASAAGITDTSLADDAEITIDIDQIGSSTAGAGLKVWLIGTRTL